MILPLPSPEERAALIAEHFTRNRYPEAFTCKVPGDGGDKEELRVLLGVPAGDASGWSNSVAATLKPSLVDADEDALVADCLLWPAPKDWAKVVEKWPGIVGRVARACRIKLGSSFDAIDEPPKGAAPPEAIKAAQAANSRAVWRILSPLKDLQIHVAIAPPSEQLWRAFRDAIQPATAPVWSLTLDFAEASLVASSIPAKDVFEPWPGLALLIALTASHLAGLNAEFERGEF